ncbi:MAG: hypothetical protein ACRDLP_08410 [Solirubrobacteraceae bacterium]
MVKLSPIRLHIREGAIGKQRSDEPAFALSEPPRNRHVGQLSPAAPSVAPQFRALRLRRFSMLVSRVVRNCLACVLICAGLAGFTGRTTVAPNSLLRALADSRFVLPAGYSSSKALSLSESGGPAVGGVTITLIGPKQHGLLYNGIVYYTVFRASSDAAAVVTRPIGGPTAALHLIAHSVPGLGSLPGARFSGTVIGRNRAGKAITNTFSEASIADGNVAVKVVTIDAAQDELPVLRSAITHLTSAQQPASRR